MKKINPEGKIIILHQHNGDNNSWSEIKNSDLDLWMKDGSIKPGDRIVYPGMIFLTISVNTLGTVPEDWCNPLIKKKKIKNEKIQKN